MNAFFLKLSEFRKKCILTEAPDTFLHKASQLYFLLMNASALISTKEWLEVQSFENVIPESQEELFHYLWFKNALARYHCFIWKDFDAAQVVTGQIINNVSGLFQHEFIEVDLEKKSMVFILTLNLIRLSFYQRKFSLCQRQLLEFKAFLAGDKNVHWKNFPEELKRIMDKEAAGLIERFKSDDFDYFILKLKIVEDKLFKAGFGYKNLLDNFYHYASPGFNKTAFTDYDKSRDWSWKDIDLLSNGVASLLPLTTAGESYALICIQQNALFPAGIIASWKAHYIPVMIHENYTTYELDQIEKVLSGKKIVYIADHRYADKFDTKNAIIIQEDLKSDRENVTIDNGDFALGLFTSGSSGIPKLCLFTHENLLRAAEIEVENDEVFLKGTIANLRPHYTSAGLNTLWPVLLTGSKLILSEKIRKTPMARFLNEFIEKNDLSALVLSPTYILSIFRSNDEEMQSSKKLTLYFGGSSLPWEILKKLMENKFLPVMRYGMTEVGHILSRKSYHMNQDAYDKADVGVPFNNFDLTCIDGFINIKSSGNASVILDQGSRINISPLNGYQTADRGRLDFTGTLLLEGRDNNTVSINGFRFNPQQVEEILMLSKSIVDCRVAGFKNEDEVQKLTAFILLKKDMNKVAVEAELRKLAGENLSSFKWPFDYVFLNEWPVSTNGKIDFNKLKV